MQNSYHNKNYATQQSCQIKKCAKAKLLDLVNVSNAKYVPRIGINWIDFCKGISHAKDDSITAQILLMQNPCLMTHPFTLPFATPVYQTSASHY